MTLGYSIVSDNLTERVLTLRDAGVVKRSHTCRTLMDRNVAEHSHGVAMLVILLYQHAGMVPSGELLAAALCHDLSEIATGDIPAPAKRYHPGLKAELNKITTAWENSHGLRYTLTAEDQALLFWCDRMDFALYALEEVNMGNRFFVEYLTRILDWLGESNTPSIGGNKEHALQLYVGVCEIACSLLGIEVKGKML